MSRYRFVFDRDSEGASDVFSKSRVVTLDALGLPPRAPDEDVIAAAAERKCILVTANGKDFVQKAMKYIAQSSRRRTGSCHDLSGLVILPTGLEIQRRLLREARQRVRIYGRPLSWADVAAKSYYVRFKGSGPADVRLLPRCPVCQRNTLRRATRTAK